VCVCVDQWSLFFFMASLSDDEIRCKIQLKYSNAAPQNSGIVLKRDTSGITHTHTPLQSEHWRSGTQAHTHIACYEVADWLFKACGCVCRWIS